MKRLNIFSKISANQFSVSANFLICLATIVFGLTTSANAQTLNKKQIEQAVSESIKKAYAASVRIWGIDTLTNRQNSAQFTGVVVHPDGQILTAAHAIVPGKKYRVVFPNGTQATAIALGRIAYEPRTGRPDVGMMKILDSGKWPAAEMGWSKDLKKNELCISIAYPTTLGKSFPTIRVGRISNPLTPWGFVESTCKMEPGDSGGPLLDRYGRVIALHSRIEISEQVNFEIPVDLYRQYWTALQISKDYPALPDKTDSLKSVGELPPPLPVEALANLTEQFPTFEGAVKNTVVLIKSVAKGKNKQILGTLIQVKPNSSAYKGSLVISKASEVGDSILVFFGDEKLSANVLATYPANDLVLLSISKELKSGLSMAQLKNAPQKDATNLGNFLISILPKAPNEISALSSTNFDIARKFSSGYFGASANFIDQKITLTRINPGSPAAIAGLQLNDQITGISGVGISQPPQYGEEIMKYSPGDQITVEGIRNNSPFELTVSLTHLPPQGSHPAYHFFGGRSFRCDGFSEVFAHDAALVPSECGGPIFDADGNFCGINIARFSRTASLALPPKKIYQFLASTLKVD